MKVGKNFVSYGHVFVQVLRLAQRLVGDKVADDDGETNEGQDGDECTI